MREEGGEGGAEAPQPVPSLSKMGSMAWWWLSVGEEGVGERSASRGEGRGGGCRRWCWLPWWGWRRMLGFCGVVGPWAAKEEPL